MDLKEMRGNGTRRHPWEGARAAAIAHLLHPYLREGVRVLDVGCGDGYLCRALFGKLRDKRVNAVDINLSEEAISRLEPVPGITYFPGLPKEGEKHDLALLLDVVEHVEDDRGFLARIAREQVSDGGALFITVPAFQLLFSNHDRFLGHYRRYKLPDLEEVAQAAGLRVIRSGYLFGSLLVPKLVLHRLLDRSGGAADVGSWRGGPALTAFLETLLRLDNAFMLRAAVLGVRLPGLSAWALCRKTAATFPPDRKLGRPHDDPSSPLVTLF